SVRPVDKTSLSPFFVASIRSQSSRAIPEIGSCPSASQAFISATETSLKSSAGTTSTSSPSHWMRYWCIVEGIQQLAWIQSLPSNTVYVLLLLMMKNEVRIVLRPTVNSTLKTPIASDGCPLKSLSVTLVLMRSAEEHPNWRSTEYGIRLTAALVSTNILLTGLPLMKPLRYSPFKCL